MHSRADEFSITSVRVSVFRTYGGVFSYGIGGELVVEEKGVKNGIFLKINGEIFADFAENEYLCSVLKEMEILRQKAEGQGLRSGTSGTDETHRHNSFH